MTSASGPGWIEHINDQVLRLYNTRLAGGFAEPYYLAGKQGDFAEIRFTCDYTRSALHELAHWCVAGASRRELDDYGYWYEPDGRSAAQQAQFFQVEIRPQAIERHFCDAAGIPFSVSVDNLGNPVSEGISGFTTAVDSCYLQLQRTGLPGRAAQIYRCLQEWTRRGNQ